MKIALSTLRPLSLKARLAMGLASLLLMGSSGIGAPAVGHRLAPLSGSGLRGQVVLRACYQAVPIGSPCPALPFQGIIEVRAEDGRGVTTFRTDARGLFQMPLRPGRYVLRPQAMVTLDVWGTVHVTFPYDESMQVVVTQGRMTSVTVAYGRGF